MRRDEGRCAHTTEPAGGRAALVEPVIDGSTLAVWLGCGSEPLGGDDCASPPAFGDRGTGPLQPMCSEAVVIVGAGVVSRCRRARWRFCRARRSASWRSGRVVTAC